MSDEKYMNIAIELAKRGAGNVNPNPMVGAVIVMNGEIIGQGYHEKYGELHAERNALKNCTKSPEGATMYVTLEPCCHYGKTPPCTEAIIEAGISKVVIGNLDPNPLVDGINVLSEAGIEVIYPVMEQECKEINRAFFHYIKNKTPYVTMKYAMTMDGKIATVTGESKWITGEKARQNVHVDRNENAAIMVGIGTVISDNPLLTSRIDGGINPIRVICDTSLRLPIDCNIFKTAKDIKTIIATCVKEEVYHKKYLEAGFEVITLEEKDGHVDLRQLMKCLGEMRIDSVLLEGGSNLNYSAICSGIVNRVQAYISPKILGGKIAKTPVGGMGIPAIDEAVILKPISIKTFGSDHMIESEVM